MKRLNSTRATAQSSQGPQPEDFDDPVALKEQIFTMLHGDHFWHGRIRRILDDAGCFTRRIKRLEFPRMWEALLTRTSFDLDDDKGIASQQIRMVLEKSGLKILHGEFNITDRRGDMLRCVFMLELGAPGVWRAPPRRASQRQLRLQPV